MPAPPAFSKTELLTLAGFLAGYSGLTANRTSWTYASSPAKLSSLSRSQEDLSFHRD